MKNLLFFITAIAMLCAQSPMQAQQTPQFQMTIHFEDAVGNKDSIIIGYDSNAVFGPNLIDTQFGESIINEPFDSIFEVRVAVAVDSSWNYLTAKKAINPLSDVEGSSCGLVDGLIYMNVRHWPITIRYDSAHLNSNPCHADAILTPDEIVFLVPNWQEHVRVIYCLGHTDSIEDRYDIEGLPAGAYVVEVISSQKNKPAYYKLIRQ